MRDAKEEGEGMYDYSHGDGDEYHRPSSTPPPPLPGCKEEVPHSKVFLGPKDDHVGPHGPEHGSWLLTATNGRYAAVTNVRRPSLLSHHLDNPLVFAYLFRAVSVLCLALFFVAVDRHKEGIHRAVDRRENYVYEVARERLERIGEDKDGEDGATRTPSALLVDLLLYYLPLALDKSTGPLLIPVVVLWILAGILRKIPFKVSRGMLVTSFVASDLEPSMWVKNFRRGMKGLEYDGFNMVLGDNTCSYHITNRCSSGSPTLHLADDSGGTLYVTKLEKGRCYGVSNAGLDTPWGKMTKGKAMFSDMVRVMGCRGDAVYGRAPEARVGREEGARGMVEELLGCTEKCERAVTGCKVELEE